MLLSLGLFEVPFKPGPLILLIDQSRLRILFNVKYIGRKKIKKKTMKRTEQVNRARAVHRNGCVENFISEGSVLQKWSVGTLEREKKKKSEKKCVVTNKTNGEFRKRRRKVFSFSIVCFI